MKQGNLVLRKSYGGDIVFKIQNVINHHAILKGIDYRLLADSPLVDLIMVSDKDVQEARGITDLQTDKLIKNMLREMSAARNKMYFDLPGKILHLDGDPMYLKKSMEIYSALQIPAEGYYIPEVSMPDVVERLLYRARPDILVITGHDGILKEQKNKDLYSLNSYKNSANFVKAVGIARQYERNRDELAIIAGACQSHFEAILHAGANFASSPARVLIHALDPLYIAVKTAYTSVRDTVDVMSVINNTFSGMKGLGGIETRGSHRRGLPNMQQQFSVIKT